MQFGIAICPEGVTRWRSGKKISRARVVRTTEAINPTAKRLLTELEVPNKTGELLPGAYGHVTLKIEGNKSNLTIPDGNIALQIRKTCCWRSPSNLNMLSDQLISNLSFIYL